MLTADVFVNIPVKSIARAYTYHIPEALAQIGMGWRVFVPFGGRQVEGFVLAVKERPAGDTVYKDILSAVDEEAWFSEVMIKAAKWLADFYLCSLAEIMRLFMPGKSGLKIEVLYAADEVQSGHPLLQLRGCAAIYGCLLEHGPMGRAELRRALPEEAAELEAFLQQLQQHGLVRKEYMAKKRASELYEKYVVLQAAVDEALLQRFSRRPAQRRLLELLQAEDGQSAAALRGQGISLSVLHAVEAEGIVAVRQRRILRDSYEDVQAERLRPALTTEQQAVLEALVPALEQRTYRGFLLYGVTGSGKTQVYIETALRVRQQGRRVIVLVPEIALTGQLVQSFKAYFTRDIIVMHSRLSIHERNDAIFRIRKGEAGVIIGARSALFTPVEDVGCIILDEEQDMSYKQDESPRYHARVAAEELARLHGAVLLLGSATPSMESCYRAAKKAYAMLQMPHRIGARPLPQVECVDMREELRLGNRHIISRPLQALIEQTVARKEQLILMLNRRGYSTFIMCRACGHVMKCRFCGMPLVYHKSGRLSCHHCDVTESVPDVCPKCGSRYIKYFGSGTEKLEQELKALVPQARVVRMDRDTTTEKFAHSRILEAFRRGEYDILLGTQMVAKGHDIPNVTAVGIISADSSLNMPDFRAAERCFMLITQTAGRAGRGEIPGRVIVQSYNPEHYAVQCGIRQDYEGFYRAELAMRRQLFFPPFSRLVKLTFQNEDEAKAMQAAGVVRDAFRAAFAGQEGQQVLGPTPASIARFRDVYRFCLLIKTAELEAVQQFLRGQGLQLRMDVVIDIDPISTL